MLCDYFSGCLFLFWKNAFCFFVTYRWVFLCFYLLIGDKLCAVSFCSSIWIRRVEIDLNYKKTIYRSDTLCVPFMYEKEHLTVSSFIFLRRLSKNGWWDINPIRADPSEETLKDALLLLLLWLCSILCSEMCSWLRLLSTGVFSQCLWCCKGSCTPPFTITTFKKSHLEWDCIKKKRI